MTILDTALKPFMTIAGLLTSSMLMAVIDPDLALSMFFSGATISGTLGALIMRSWGFLITGIGILLIYGAFTPKYRSFILVITSTTKAVFIIFLLSFGFLEIAMLTILIDSIVVLVAVLYLVSDRQQQGSLLSV